MPLKYTYCMSDTPYIDEYINLVEKEFGVVFKEALVSFIVHREHTVVNAFGPFNEPNSSDIADVFKEIGYTEFLGGESEGVKYKSIITYDQSKELAKLCDTGALILLQKDLIEGKSTRFECVGLGTMIKHNNKVKGEKPITGSLLFLEAVQEVKRIMNSGDTEINILQSIHTTLLASPSYLNTCEDAGEDVYSTLLTKYCNCWHWFSGDITDPLPTAFVRGDEAITNITCGDVIHRCKNNKRFISTHMIKDAFIYHLERMAYKDVMA